MNVTPDITAILQKAIAFHQRGNLSEARPLYQNVLRAVPTQFEALHFLGLLESQGGNLIEAENLVRRSLEVNSSRPEAFSNYARLLRTLDRHEDAIVACDKALRLNPRFSDAFILRANALSDVGRISDALTNVDQALALQPGNPVSLTARGAILGKLGRHTEALSSYEGALAAAPGFVQAITGRGNTLVALGRHEEALASYARALSLAANDLDALLCRARLLEALRRPQEALRDYDRLIALKPDSAEAHNERGSFLAASGHLRDALQSFDRAVEIQPNYAEAHNNRGNVLGDLNRFEDARASYLKAIEIRPDPRFHSNLIFNLNFEPEMNTAEQQAERVRWNNLYASPFSKLVAPHRNDPDPNRRLSVGYVSSHFRHQAGTYAFAGVILSHNPDQFEVVCYSDSSQADEVTTRLRDRADTWCSIVGLSDDDVAQKIRADGIDILVDCVGHMQGHRLLVFARKPAPVQVTGWGEPTGTGLEAMDYLLADPILVPASERQLLVETVFDLPNFLGYWTPAPLPEPGPLPALSNGYVTFGSFNRSVKVQDPVLRCWAAILRTLPTARLVLKGYQVFPQSNQRGTVDAIMQAEGVDPARVTLLGQTDRAGHFQAYQGIDIALDPFPHAGGMTTLDALWMGVPVVATSGRTISSRLAAATLTALDLTDFIAADGESYIQLAVGKARDVQALADLRASLRGRVANSAVGDPQRYAQAVESAYREMWRRWCSGQKAH